MTITEYQNHVERSLADLQNLEKNLLHMRMGVVTEVGEIVDIFKRNLAYKKEIDYTNLSEEIGDLSFYFVGEAILLNLKLVDKKEVIPIKQPIIYELFILDQRVHGENPTLSIQGAIGLLKSISQDLGFSFEKILETNINKLKARYPEKFTQEKALNRDLVKEREVLESGI